MTNYRLLNTNHNLWSFFGLLIWASFSSILSLLWPTCPLSFFSYHFLPSVHYLFPSTRISQAHAGHATLFVPFSRGRPALSPFLLLPCLLCPCRHHSTRRTSPPPSPFSFRPLIRLWKTISCPSNPLPFSSIFSAFPSLVYFSRLRFSFRYCGSSIARNEVTFREKAPMVHQNGNEQPIIRKWKPSIFWSLFGIETDRLGQIHYLHSADGFSLLWSDSPGGDK